MSGRAHDDVLAYATREVCDSAAKLKTAEDTHRGLSQPPCRAVSGNAGDADTTVEGKVWENLIEAKTNFNAQLAAGVSGDTMQMRMLGNRISAMQTALRDVHGRMAQNGPGGQPDASLASVLSEYDALHLDEGIDAKVYERALMALAGCQERRQPAGCYLDAFVRPGLPEQSMYPIRWRIILETALLSLVAWCLLQLLYHGIRDHID